MSTDPRGGARAAAREGTARTGTAHTRRARSRKRRGRAFALSFTVVIAVLAVVGLGAAAATTAQGPRVTEVHVDPAAAASASGSRLILKTTQALRKVDPAQVTVTPATHFTVDTSGRSVGVRFTLPLFDDTKYTVRIDGLEGIGGGPTSSVVQTFKTPPIDVFLLRRGGEGDAIIRTDLEGRGAVTVYRGDHIEDFRATASHLVVSVRTDDDKAELIVTDLDGKHARPLPLPGDGFVTNLQSADRGELVGYTFSDATLSATSGRESALFTASLRDAAAKDAPTPVTVTGSDPRVGAWRFVPDTDSILLLTFDGKLMLTDSKGADPVSLGIASSIDGIARGSSQAVVDRADGQYVIDLTDGTETRLIAPTDDIGLPGQVTPIPGDKAGTLRTFARVKDSITVLGTTIAVVADDGTATPVFDRPAGDAVLQTCVSPSGRYAAILVAPDVVSNPYDQYLLPLPGQVETHVVELAGPGSTTEKARDLITLSGWGLSWCQVPPG